MHEPSEKNKLIIATVLSLAVLLALLPITGVFSKNPPLPPPSLPPSTTEPGTFPPSPIYPPSVIPPYALTLPPVTNAPIVEPPLVTDARELADFNMANDLPPAGAIILSGAHDSLRADVADRNSYLTLSALKDGVGNALWGLPSLSLEYRGAGHAATSESAFTVEVTFVKNESTVPVSLSLITDSNLAAEQPVGRASEILLTLSESGQLMLGTYSLGNVKSETLAVSILFSYEETRELYLADVYVNGILSLANLPYATIGNIAAKELAEKDSHGISGIALLSDAIYTDAPSGSVQVGEINYTPTHHNAFASDGTLKYSLKIDDLYFIKGIAAPNTPQNASTLVLYTNGRTLSGFTPAQNDRSVVSAPVEWKGNRVSLPTIDGGWRAPSGAGVVTEVSAATLSGSGYSAYAPLPDTKLYQNDFTASTNGLTVGGATLDAAGGRLLLGHGSALSYSFGSAYRTGYDPIVTLTLALTLERLAEDAPPLTVSLAGEAASAPYLLSMSRSALTFAGGAIRGELPAPGKKTELLLQVNCGKGGTALTVYTNGIYTGYAILDDATLTLNTMLATDLDRLSLEVGDGADASLALHALSISRGSNAPGVAPLQNASIRIGETESETGLRFTFAVNRLWYESLATSDDAILGAIIVPTDNIPVGVALSHATLDAADVTYTELKIESFDGESSAYSYLFDASYISIAPRNHARYFTAIGYLRIGEEYYYSSPSCSSIVTAAHRCISSGEIDAYDPEERDRVIDSLHLDTIVCLTSSLSLIEIEGYSSPYTATHENDTLIIRLKEGREGSLSDITAILIGNTVYTKGWTVNDNILTAPFSLS